MVETTFVGALGWGSIPDIGRRTVCKTVESKSRLSAAKTALSSGGLLQACCGRSMSDHLSPLYEDLQHTPVTSGYLRLEHADSELSDEVSRLT